MCMEMLPLEVRPLLINLPCDGYFMRQFLSHLTTLFSLKHNPIRVFQEGPLLPIFGRTPTYSTYSASGRSQMVSMWC